MSLSQTFNTITFRDRRFNSYNISSKSRSFKNIFYNVFTYILSKSDGELRVGKEMIKFRGTHENN